MWGLAGPAALHPVGRGERHNQVADLSPRGKRRRLPFGKAACSVKEVEHETPA